MDDRAGGGAAVGDLVVGDAEEVVAELAQDGVVGDVDECEAGDILACLADGAVVRDGDGAGLQCDFFAGVVEDGESGGCEDESAVVVAGHSAVAGEAEAVALVARGLADHEEAVALDGDVEVVAGGLECALAEGDSAWGEHEPAAECFEEVV